MSCVDLRQVTLSPSTCLHRNIIFTLLSLVCRTPLSRVSFLLANTPPPLPLFLQYGRPLFYILTFSHSSCLHSSVAASTLCSLMICPLVSSFPQPANPSFQGLSSFSGYATKLSVCELKTLYPFLNHSSPPSKPGPPVSSLIGSSASSWKSVHFFSLPQIVICPCPEDSLSQISLTRRNCMSPQ